MPAACLCPISGATCLACAPAPAIADAPQGCHLHPHPQDAAQHPWPPQRAGSRLHITGRLLTCNTALAARGMTCSAARTARGLTISIAPSSASRLSCSAVCSPAKQLCWVAAMACRRCARTPPSGQLWRIYSGIPGCAPTRWVGRLGRKHIMPPALLLACAFGGRNCPAHGQ